MTNARTYPRRGLHGAVVHDIGVRILSGELEPGDPLPSEDELAAGIGGEPSVSRTVLREAVKVLAAKRLVASKPKLGTRVLPRREWNLLDPDVLAWQLEAGMDRTFLDQLLEVRGLIEPQAARLAALRATDEEVEQLEAAVEEMQQAGEDANAFLAPDLRFHSLLLKATNNELIEHMATILSSVLRTLFTYAGRPAGAYGKATGLHAAVVAAIRAHDPDAAEAALLALSGDTTGNLTWAIQHGVEHDPSRARSAR